MKTVDEATLAKLKEEMFKKEAKGVDYQIDEFDKCYHKYMGGGNHMYILVKEYDDKVEAIGDLRINGRLISNQLKRVAKEFRVLVVDVEMGGMSVWKND
jgi:hypothetical protein